MRILKFRVFLVSAVILLGIGCCMLILLKRSSSRDIISESQVPDTLESLRSLPYIQWTDGNVNADLLGVTRYDAEHSYPGYNFYTNDDDEVYLMDMRGRKLHTWYLPGKKQCECAELLENGDLIAVCVEEAILRLDWNSKVVWENKNRVHHDLAILPDHRVLVLNRDNAVKYNSYDVEFDSILYLSESGQILDRWSTFENLPRIQKFHPPTPLDASREAASHKKGEFMFFDYYHLNTVKILPPTELGKKDRRFQAGNVLICSRHVNWIAILDKVTKDVVWSWGPGMLDGPHNSTMLENGNILIFDNGTRRKWSRVLEIDPVSLRVVWEYKGNPLESFFSAWRGSSQRLPNGNTLITDSEVGHVFEIDKRGKTVWEFWNPVIRHKKRKRVYRMTRLLTRQVVPLLQKRNARINPPN
jgi:hypothetical protein